MAAQFANIFNPSAAGQPAGSVLDLSSFLTDEEMSVIVDIQSIIEHGEFSPTIINVELIDECAW